MPHLYEVGKPYIAGKARWPEGIEYAWRGGSHELRLFFARPSSNEKQAIRKGMAEYALVVEQPVILLLSRFGGMEWSDAPYSIHLEKEADRVAPPEVSGDQRYLITNLLVDASTGFLEVIRVASLSTVFTAALHQAIRDQLAAPFDQAAYDAHLKEVYRVNPTSTRLLRLSVARCAAGE